MPRRQTTELKTETYGFRQLARALRELPPELRRETTRALKAVGGPIEARARTLAPKRSGTLAGSIKTRVLRTGIRIGTTLPYGPVLEFAHKGDGGGTRRSSRSSRAGTRSMSSTTTGSRDYSSLSAKYGPPARYLYRATDELAPTVAPLVTRAIDAAQKRVLDHRFTERD